MASPLSWVGSAEVVDDGSIKLKVRVQSIVVDLLLQPDRSFGAIFQPDFEDACGEAMDCFGRYLEQRHIVAFRLLRWAREVHTTPSPPSTISSAVATSEGVSFVVTFGDVLVDVLVRHDLSGAWPGAIGVSTEDGALAWAAYDAAVEYLEANAALRESVGFEPGCFDTRPDDPPFGSRV